jgi:hypothetical protein
MNYLHRGPSRRTFLRAGAVTIGLPLLNAMLPASPGAEKKAAASRPRRLLLIARVLGTNGEYFFPRKAGPDYEPTRYLKLVDRHRGRFTVFSGLSHLGYPNLHHTEAGLLSGMAPERIQSGDDIHPTVSLDQFVAEKVGRATRFPCVLMGEPNTPMTYNRDGVPVPCEPRPEETFKRLFLDGTPDAVGREVLRLQDGQSILDGVRDQLRGIGREVGPEDRARLDLLAASIREAEQELRQEQAWAGKPKAKVDRKAEDYRNVTWSSGQKMRYDLAVLAFQTDSTRVAVALEGEGSPGDAPGATLGHHDASHHGQDPRKIEQFSLYEEEETRNIGLLLDKLAGAKEGEGTLLDRTTVFWGSNIGNPSAHASNNLPILVAGGGLKHQGHVAFDRKSNKPLSNLYVRLLHQMGVEATAFGSSSGVLSEIG